MKCSRGIWKHTSHRARCHSVHSQRSFRFFQNLCANHRHLHGSVDRLTATRCPEAFAQLTGRNRNQQLCKIDSGAVDQARMDIIRRRRSADRATYLPIAPPEIADAPPHQEIEVLLAFCIVNVIAAGSGELQITRRFVPGQIFPVPFTNGHTETIYRPLALLEFGGYCLW